MHTTIINCARCGETHAKIQLKKFQSPPGGVLKGLTHWALCPKTKEPILIEVKEIK